MDDQQREELAQRVQALEQNATGDGAAFASVYNIINPEGGIEPVFEQGPEGPEGPAGPEGPEGPAGAKGEKGAEGKQGPEGKEGKEGPAGPEGKEGKEGPAGGGGKVAHGGGELVLLGGEVFKAEIPLEFEPASVLLTTKRIEEPETPVGHTDYEVELTKAGFNVYSSAPHVLGFYWVAYG